MTDYIITMMANGQVIKIVSAVVTHKGKILLLQRDDNPEIRDPGRWQLPGGGVEQQENPDQAMQRELHEEIGFVPVDLRFFTAPSDDTHAYIARLTDDEVKNIKKGTEGKDLRFFSFAELSQIPLTRKLQEVLENQGETLRSIFTK